MKQYTQKAFDAFKVVNGYRQCPTGDYTLISIFGNDCIFGNNCSFGNNCIFGFNTKVESTYELISTSYPLLQISGAGSRQGSTQMWNTSRGIIVRTGCFLGTIAEFRKAVKATHAGTAHELTYLGFANIACVQFNRNAEIE